MEHWFDGVHLLGRCGSLKTGCWLLTHGGEAAVLELPPCLRSEGSPAAAAQRAATELGVSVKHILCTHTHGDHFHKETFSEMRKTFPAAIPVFQSGFQPQVQPAQGIQWFDDEISLALGGEPLLLVHAPKHHSTDTMVIFRGTICTGDWELNTIRTVNEVVPVDERRQSARKMIAFVRRRNYRIHRSFSVHANDRRENIDFVGLMEATQVDRKMW